MINLKDYPLFIPPPEVHSKKPREWTSNEAKLYFIWFMSVKDDRIEYLISFFDEAFSGNIEADLKRIGQKVYDTLIEELFSTEEPVGRAITNRGLALAADMSLLVSKMIVQEHPKTKWNIVKSPKNDLSFNLPALFGFPKLGHIETMAGSIANAKAILRREEESDIWWRMFKYADDILKNVN